MSKEDKVPVNSAPEGSDGLQPVGSATDVRSLTAELERRISSNAISTVGIETKISAQPGQAPAKAPTLKLEFGAQIQSKADSKVSDAKAVESASYQTGPDGPNVDQVKSPKKSASEPPAKPEKPAAQGAGAKPSGSKDVVEVGATKEISKDTLFGVGSKESEMTVPGPKSIYHEINVEFKLHAIEEDEELRVAIQKKRERMRAIAMQRILSLPEKDRKWFETDEGRSIRSPPAPEQKPVSSSSSACQHDSRSRPYPAYTGPHIPMSEPDETDIRRHTVLMYRRCADHNKLAPLLHVLDDTTLTTISNRFKDVVVQGRSGEHRDKEKKPKD